MSTKHLYKNIHSNIIHNSIKIETVLLSTNRGIDFFKNCDILIYNELLLNSKKG